MRTILFGMLVVMVGCSRALPPEPDPASAVLPPGQKGQPQIGSDLTGPADGLDLAALLKLPREELARRGEELEQTIARQNQLHAEGKMPYTLLPDLRLPLVTPIFRKATYSKERGLSLPPYLKPDARDSAIAFHLARHGDLDAAIQLLDTGDDDTAKLIRESVPEQSYPLEWTRLVALLIHAQQVALATDNKDGAKSLISLHKQLREVLDDKALHGPLGVALLGRGLTTLRQAADAWKANKRDDLDAQVRVFLASLGQLPAYSIALPSRIDDLAPAFSAKPGPNALFAVDPARVLDLLSLYVPAADADQCVAFADAAGATKEILVTYRPQLVQYHLPEQFAEVVEELASGRTDNISDDCPRRVWDFGACKLDVILTPRHATLGGLVRLQVPGEAKVAELPRDFGTVHLDRSFDAHRRLTKAGKKTGSLVLTDKTLIDVINPLATRVPTNVILEREAKHDVVSQITFEYAENPKDSVTSAGSIAKPLMSSFGKPTLAFGDGAKGSIDFVWNDGKTRYRLRFPYARDRKIALDATDSSPIGLSDRAAASSAKDAADRLERIKSNKPLTNLPRQIGDIKLGISRAEFEKAIPKSPQLIQQDIKGGMMAAYLGAPAAGNSVTREWFGRFDDDRLVEVRIRQVDLPSNKPGQFLKTFDALKAPLGPPEISTEPMTTWGDLPKRGLSTVFDWRDDLTRLKCRLEPFGFEAILRDCPPAHPDGAPLPPITYLPKGIGVIKLGMTKDDLLKLNAKSTEPNEFLINSPAPEYDSLLARLDGDRVTRIIARHKLASPVKDEAQASKTLLQQWVRDARSIGWPSRQDMVGPNLQSLATRDDETRYRVFWQQESPGLSVFSEWKDIRPNP